MDRAMRRIVPANTPHGCKDVEGGITDREVRFVAPSTAAPR
jgi:hypothetical protein